MWTQYNKLGLFGYFENCLFLEAQKFTYMVYGKLAITIG